MTRIDFYVLPDSDADNRYVLVCKLAEKAFRQGKAVFIHSDDQTTLSALDDKLWQFRADSFVAHRLLDDSDDPALLGNADNDPVQLSKGEPASDRQVLINLGSQVPTFFSRFERTLEVVNQIDSVRDAGRERYRFYQHRGYPLQHHKM